MLSDVASYIRKCTTCIKAKPVQRKPAGCMGGHSLIDKPWDVLSIDIVGPLPRTKRGFNYILVVADCFSKFVLTFPLRKASTKQIVGLLEDNVFLLFGVPRRIICDNGVQFKSRDFRRFFVDLRVSLVCTVTSDCVCKKLMKNRKLVMTCVIDPFVSSLIS
ncbi:Integrase core domain [Popillia japonica]|uniref:Integrase core domain n=1 Tax=Popillia japonica TaxID=7064 RepID=A0AAW1MG43_POPJA